MSKALFISQVEAKLGRREEIRTIVEQVEGDDTAAFEDRVVRERGDKSFFRQKQLAGLDISGSEHALS